MESTSEYFIRSELARGVGVGRKVLSQVILLPACHKPILFGGGRRRKMTIENAEIPKIHSLRFSPTV